MTTALILSGWLLSLVLTGALCFLLLRQSPTSSPTSPTPSTPPTPISAPPDSTPFSTEMWTSMMELMRSSLAEDRALVERLVLGRESPPTIYSSPPQQSWNEKPIGFDYDSTPLAPGIEAVLARETIENEQSRLLKERADLQAKLREMATEADRLGLEDFLPGPWQGSDDQPT